jgi:hypothetical protein
MYRLYPLLFLLIIGCGAAPTKQTAVTSTTVPVIGSLPAPGQFYTPGLKTYASQEGLTQNSLERRLERLVKRTLRPSPAFDCLAREYAARFGADGRDPVPLVVYALAHHCGYWRMPTSSHSVTAKSITALEAHLAKLPDQLLHGAMGIGAVNHGDGRVSASILVPPGDLKLDPITRDGAFQLSGRLVLGDGQVEFWSQNKPGGLAHKLYISLSATGDFKFLSHSTKKPIGIHRLEIARVRGRFRQTIAVIQRGPVRPRSYAMVKPVPIPPAPPLTTRDVVAEINRYRKVRQLPPFQFESHLSGPLADWLQRVSNGSKSSMPQGILDSRGWPYPQLEYGFTHGDSAENAVKLLADSPTGSRMLNLTGDDHVGVGILPFSNKRGADVVIIALRRFEILAPPTAREMLLNRVNQMRTSAALSALRLEPITGKVAQTAAQAVLAGHLQWQRSLPTVMSTLEKEKLVDGQFAVGGLTVIHPSRLKASDEPNLMMPTAKRIGIGIAGGLLPGKGTPRYIVIYIVSEKAAPVGSKTSDRLR